MVRSTTDEATDVRGSYDRLSYAAREDGFADGDRVELTYESPYSGTTVTVTGDATDVSASSFTLALDDGREWVVFEGSIRTTEDSRRASGTVDGKNGRTVGYVEELVVFAPDDEAEVVADGGAVELDEPERIRDLSDLNVGDKVVFEDRKRPLTVVDRSFLGDDDSGYVTVEGDWSNARSYDISQGSFGSISMPDKGAVQVRRTHVAEDASDEDDEPDIWQDANEADRRLLGDADAEDDHEDLRAGVEAAIDAAPDEVTKDGAEWEDDAAADTVDEVERYPAVDEWDWHVVADGAIELVGYDADGDKVARRTYKQTSQEARVEVRSDGAKDWVDAETRHPESVDDRAGEWAPEARFVPTNPGFRDIREGDRVEVEYDAAKGDGHKTKTGTVTSIAAGSAKIIRVDVDDGRELIVGRYHRDVSQRSDAGNVTRLGDLVDLRVVGTEDDGTDDEPEAVTDGGRDVLAEDVGADDLEEGDRVECEATPLGEDEPGRVTGTVTKAKVHTLDGDRTGETVEFEVDESGNRYMRSGAGTVRVQDDDGFWVDVAWDSTLRKIASDDEPEVATDGGVEPGEVFPVEWHVVAHSNRAATYTYPIRVDVFLHRFEDTGEWALLVDQDWLDDHADGDGAESAEYARAYIDGTHVDPSDVFGHERIDRPTATDGGRDTLPPKPDARTPPDAAREWAQDRRVVYEAVNDATEDELRAIVGDVVDTASDADEMVRVRQAVNPSLVARKGLEAGFGDPHFDDNHPEAKGNMLAYHVHPEDDLASVRNRILQALAPDVAHGFAGP